MTVAIGPVLLHRFVQISFKFFQLHEIIFKGILCIRTFVLEYKIALYSLALHARDR